MGKTHDINTRSGLYYQGHMVPRAWPPMKDSFLSFFHKNQPLGVGGMYHLGGVKGSGCRNRAAASRSRLSSVNPSPRSWERTQRLASLATPEKAGCCCWSLWRQNMEQP